MADMGDSSVKPQRVSPNVGRVLVSTILEWLLIFLLFVDAVFAYLITRFARYCKLQTPCLLCSRLDHVFGNKRLKHYWDLICSSHKSEISSLVAHGRCDSCNEPRILKGYSWELVKTESIKSEGVELRSSSGIDHLSHVGYNKLKVNSDSESEVVSSDDESGLKHELEDIRPRTVALSEDLVLEKLIDPVSATEPSSNTFVSIDTLVDAVEASNSASVDEISQPFDAVETSMAVDASGESKPIPVNDVPLSLNEMEIPAEVAKDEEKVDAIDVATSSTAAESHAAVPEESCVMTGVELKDETVICEGETVPSASEEDKLKTESLESDAMDFGSVSIDPLSHVRYKELKVTSDDELEDISFDNNDNTSQELKHEINDIRPKIVKLSDVSVSERLIDPVSAPEPSSSANSMESPVRVGEESKMTLPNEIAQSVNADEKSMFVAASEESKVISDHEAPQSSQEMETLPEEPTDDRVTPIDVPATSNSSESPLVEADKESCVTKSGEPEETSFKESEAICEAQTVPKTSEEAAAAMEKNPVSSNTCPQSSNLLDLNDAYKVAVGSTGKQLLGSLAEQWAEKDNSSRISADLKLLISQLSVTRGFEQPVYDMSPKVSLNSDELKASDATGMQILQKRISLERNESGLESLDGISVVSEIEGESLVDRLKRQVEHDKKLLIALYRELEEERNASTIAVNQAMAMITKLQEEKASLHMEALQNIRMMEEQAEYDMETLQKTSDLLAEKEKEIQELEAELEFYRKKSEITENRETKDSLLEFEGERSYILRCLKKLEKKLYLFAYNGLSPDLANGIFSENEGEDQENAFATKETTELDLTSLADEVLDLSERIGSLEADQNFLELTMNSLKNREDSVGFVREIASHLRELRRIGIRRD